MIHGIVAAISDAIAHPSALSFAAALAWGFLSVFLSPCHISSIPLIVGYINNGNRPGRRLAATYSLLFGAGLLTALAVIGFLTSALGRLLGDVGLVVRVVIALMLIACGLWLMDIPPLSGIAFSFNIKPSRRGPLGAMTLGLIYGVALGPCSFAFLAPMLGFVFSAAIGSVAYGAVLMVCYAVGHTVAVVIAGTFGDYVLTVLKRRGAEASALWIKRAMGALVVLAGIIQLRDR